MLHHLFVVQCCCKLVTNNEKMMKHLLRVCVCVCVRARAHARACVYQTLFDVKARAMTSL